MVDALLSAGGESVAADVVGIEKAGGLEEGAGPAARRSTTTLASIRKFLGGLGGLGVAEP